MPLNFRESKEIKIYYDMQYNIKSCYLLQYKFCNVTIQHDIFCTITIHHGIFCNIIKIMLYNSNHADPAPPRNKGQ